MTSDLVDGEASGESNTTLPALRLFLVENLRDLFFNEIINLSADVMNVCIGHSLGGGECKSSYKKFWSKNVQVANLCFALHVIANTT